MKNDERQHTHDGGDTVVDVPWEEEHEDTWRGRRSRSRSPGSDSLMSPVLTRTRSASSRFLQEHRHGQHESLLGRIDAPVVLLAYDEDEDATSLTTCAAEDGEAGFANGGASSEPQHKKNGMKMAFMNMANSIIGAGIIGQPYALLQCGLATGLILLVSLTFVIDWTIRLMVVNAKLSATNSYQATVSACFGRAGYFAISLAQGLFAFGGSIAFTVIIGDTIPHVVLAIFPRFVNIPVLNWLTQRSPVMVLAIAFVSFPLSLSKNIANLAKASLLALISMVIIIVAVLIEGIRTPPDLRGGAFTLPLLTINSSLFQGIGVISFAFVCHHNSLLIYGALRKPTMDRFARVTHWSTGVSMVACMTLGLSGFLTFRDQTDGNVLNNFPGTNTVINVARFCFGFNMLTTFPLEIFVCREVILDYMYTTIALARARKRETEYDALQVAAVVASEVQEDDPIDEMDEEEMDIRPSLFAHVATTAVLSLAALIFALTVQNLGIVLEVVGSTSACMLAYILPPMCYLKLAQSEASRRWTARIGPIACVTFGVTVMVVSISMSIAKAFS
ncbi:transmembrane amino acid transporter protein-domain-containing protein [Limtongia smithiae]|uniref:transmembrane amino acid transporter protein-domain-containing protein n=1 Tax=Limtongia smithiae TaxID=1125753 RepID=UPI0034D0208B